MDFFDRTNRTDMIDLFLDRNSKINLSAIRDADGVWEKHILDSLELTTRIDLDDGLHALDLGTGG
jgi:16S rRNA G527 N7-methylase RsmG